MSDLTYIEKITRHFLENMAYLPEDFEIHSLYLKDNKKGDFIKGFKEYYNFVKSLYEKIRKNPEDFDVPIISINEDEKGTNFQKTYKGFIRVISFLYCIGYSGIVKKDKLGAYLLLDGSILSELFLYTRTTNPKAIINALADIGLAFENFDYNQEIESYSQLIVRFSKNPFVLIVLKALVEANQNITNNLRNIKEPFMRVDCRIFKKYSKKEPTLTTIESTESLTKNERLIVKELDTLIKKLDYHYHTKIVNLAKGEWITIYTHPKSKNDFVLIKIEENKLELKMNLNNIEKYSSYFNKYPEYIRNPIKSSKDCTDCDPLKCMGGYQFELGYINYKKCRSLPFVFKDPLYEGIKYYKQIITLEDKELSYNDEKVG